MSLIEWNNQFDLILFDDLERSDQGAENRVSVRDSAIKHL